MAPRPASHGFHFDSTNSAASVLVFFAVLIAISMVGATLCELVPWK